MALPIHGADGGGLLEDPSDLRIHLNIQVVHLSPLFMPLIDPGINPIGERLANNGVNYVGDILARQLLKLGLHHRQRRQHICILPGKLHQVLDGKAFELWYDDMLDVLGLEHFSIPIHQIFHMPYRHGLEAGKIRPDIVGEESVHFPLACEFGSKCLGRDIGERGLGCLNLLALLI